MECTNLVDPHQLLCPWFTVVFVLFGIYTPNSQFPRPIVNQGGGLFCILSDWEEKFQLCHYMSFKSYLLTEKLCQLCCQISIFLWHLLNHTRMVVCQYATVWMFKTRLTIPRRSSEAVHRRPDNKYNGKNITDNYWNITDNNQPWVNTAKMYITWH
jgi:hypothetical protein